MNKQSTKKINNHVLVESSYLPPLLCSIKPMDQIGSTLQTPDSVANMMTDVANAIVAARDNDINIGLVEIPIPVTG